MEHYSKIIPSKDKKVSMNKNLNDYDDTNYYFNGNNILDFKKVIVGYRLDFDRLNSQNDHLKSEIYGLREYGTTISNRLEYKLLKKVPRHIFYLIKSFIKKL